MCVEHHFELIDCSCPITIKGCPLCAYQYSELIKRVKTLHLDFPEVELLLFCFRSFISKWEPYVKYQECNKAKRGKRTRGLIKVHGNNAVNLGDLILLLRQRGFFNVWISKEKNDLSRRLKVEHITKQWIKERKVIFRVIIPTLTEKYLSCDMWVDFESVCLLTGALLPHWN